MVTPINFIWNKVANRPIMPLIQVSNLLVTVNSSVNFFVYCTFGQKFRTVFMQMFCGQKVQIISIIWPLHNNHEIYVSSFLRKIKKSEWFLCYIIMLCNIQELQWLVLWNSININNGQITFLNSLECKPLQRSELNLQLVIIWCIPLPIIL